MKKDSIQYTAEEKAIIKFNREQAENIKAGSEEVNEVLTKRGLDLKIVGLENLRIAVVPVRQNA